MPREPQGNHTERLADDDAHAAPSGCVITVLEGDERDRHAAYALERGSAVIGSAPGCELRLNDRKVSRRHVEITIENDGVWVRDLESTNGTRYLGQPVTRARVPMGARLQIGNTTLGLVPLSKSELIEPSDAESYDALFGRSLAMRTMYAVLERIESSEAPVLISGETGTGKELVARAVHERSRRRAGPFVVVDCGAIAHDLVEGELFGAARGAYTGAAVDRPGAIEQAHGGTLFLDEIGELPIDIQPKLLRALDRREVKRLGEAKHRTVDVRVVAATHRDLKAMVSAGDFREDLYYRLAVVTVRTPPLRERPDDIPLLTERFARELGAREALPEPMLRLLREQEWRGNVRELRNAVQRLIALGTLSPELREVAASAERALQVDPDKPYKEAREELLDRFEREYVTTLLARHDGVVAHAAREAGMSRKHMTDLVKKHGLKGD